jgi:hypothetical protein
MIAAVLALAFAAPAAAADPVRPFEARFTTVDSFVIPPSDCPSGAFLRADIVGQGEIAHLGRTQVRFTHCSWLNVETGEGWSNVGETTLTAANGDTLTLAQHATFHMSPWPDFVISVVDTFDWTVTGGTGRFEHARGQGTGHGLGVMAEGSSVYWLSGTISY